MKRRQQTPKVGHRPLAHRGARARCASGGDGRRDRRRRCRSRRSSATAACGAPIPASSHAIEEISTPPLRNMGTLGGNVLLDTRCNYYDQNYEWRQAIDFCMKKDGAICWVAPGLAEVPGGAVGRLGAGPDRARRARACSRRRTASARSPLEELYRNDGIHYLTKRPGRAPDRDPRAARRTAGRRATGSCAAAARSTSRCSRVGAAVRARGRRRRRGADRPRGRRLGAGPRRRAAEADPPGPAASTPTAIAEAAEAAAGPSRPMDNTDFSFLWRKEMTRKWVAAALGRSREPRSGRRLKDSLTAACRAPSPAAILHAFS